MQKYGPILGRGVHIFAGGGTNFKGRGVDDFCTSKYAYVTAFSDLAPKVNYYGQLSPTGEDKKGSKLNK